MTPRGGSALHRLAGTRRRPRRLRGRGWAATRVAAVAMIAALAASCRAGPEKHYGPVASRDLERSRGYALIWKVAAEEAHVDKALWIKLETDQLDELLSDIARVSGDLVEWLEERAESDPMVDLEQHGLPAVEQGARGILRSEKQDAILGATGMCFELEMLLAQVRALDYLAALLEAVAERAADEEEKTEALARSKVFRYLGGRASLMLAVQYGCDDRARDGS